MNILRIAIILSVISLSAVPGFAVDPPHTNYRSGYGTSCGDSNCHASKGRFMKNGLSQAFAPGEDDFTAYCLSCHNAGGEAHDKSVGSASTNRYTNRTGFKAWSSYKGVSHSWNGASGNAGTRTPVSAGFKATTDGADYMPGGLVRCQTCHKGMVKNQGIQNIDWSPAMDSGDHKHYTFGYQNTDQNLAQYIKVYRCPSIISSSPNLARDKKAYLVAPSEYTYDYSNATITFRFAQSATDFFYVDIPQPYFRNMSGNKANQICVDCHADRSTPSVSHGGGPARKDNHPTGIGIAKQFGTRTTLRSVTSVRLYMEAGKVVCTTCHDPHNSASNDGSLLREAKRENLCTDCHDSRKVGQHKGRKHSKYPNTTTAIPTVCTDCHGAHNSNNIYLVRDKVKTPSLGVKSVKFRNVTGSNSFGDDSGSAICEICHTTTNHHRADGIEKGHNTKKNCLKCHKHEAGFQAGGGSNPCYACHDGTGGPDIKSMMGLGTSVSSGGKASKHRIRYDNLSTSSCLTMCHTDKHQSASPNRNNSPESELSLCGNGLCHGGENGRTSQNVSINVGGRFTASMHNFTTAVQSEEFGSGSAYPFNSFSFTGNCTKCHGPHGSDSYPNIAAKVNGRTTGGNTENVCFGCHGTARFKGATDIETRWTADSANRGHYDYTANKRLNCVNCHGPHGGSNDNMIKDALGGPGLERDGICLSCHSGSGYVGQSVYNVMGTNAGEYGPGFSAASFHNFTLAVAVGGKTVDLTCVGCHDPHDNTNTRLLRKSIVFTGLTGASSRTDVRVTGTVSPRDKTTAYTSGWNDYCAACHTSMKESGGQSPYRRHPTGNAPGGFYSRTSYTGMEAAPLMNGTIACITCHFAHGSPKRDLLRFKNSTTPENRLCLQCHDNGKFLQGGAGSHGGFLQKNKGNCADCHNMHDDANKRLLTESTESVLCLGCHNSGATSKYAVWSNVSATVKPTPQKLKGTAGTFGHYSETSGGTAFSMHAINNEANPAPGGATTEHRCGSCHNPHGSKNYRVLRTTVNNVTGIKVTARTETDGSFVNYSTGFVKFCTACHTAYKTTSDSNGNWVRHPVGVSLNNYTSQRGFYENSTSYKPKVELEADKTVTCVSCHFAHGSPETANLKFPGGRTVNTCKTCHNRDSFGAGTPGAHAGFAGNNGTCSDCHSMHADGNAKLLKKGAETEVCVACHDNPGASTSATPSHLDVWKGNAFDSPESWFGTAGSFGNYEVVKGGTAPYMHPINSDARLAPGDGATVVHCGTCHDTHGSKNYRLLKVNLNGKTGISVSANVDATGHTTSYSSGMSSFCTACHKAYINYGSAAGYTRHPVDVALTAQELANYNHFEGYKYLPLEGGNRVTCTTCHLAHGSPYPQMRRMPGAQMCQVCHSKGIDTAAGYGSVMYTHGGFSGVGGDCSACHSMHAKNNRKLLVESEETQLCRGCHAADGDRRASFPTAPLAWKGDAPSSPEGWDGTGGSFGAFYNTTTGGSIMSHHDINKTDSPAPGGTTVEHRCGTCHNPHGNNNYRILRDDVNGSSGIKVRTDRFGNYSSGISGFCAACHTTYADAGTGVDGYKRHPVGLKLTAVEKANLEAATGAKVQTESGKVMCLSCHFAHGSPSRAMLRMPSYTSSESVLCQQCHKKGYNASGAQVRNTHGGFVGNNSNCAVCHSVHAKNNKKLLMEPKESSLCINCHSGIAKFNEFKSHDPDVKIDRPSRFNVFSSIGNSFGNYSVGGGGVVSHHQIDGTHTAPGGKTLELRCGKCHNPHGEDNFAMLRSTIENVTGIKVFGHLSSTGPFNTYSSGFASFCSACHTKLVNCGTGNPWTRHPVDFKLQNKQFSNWSATPISPKVPLEAGRQVTCITCHQSHGSKNYSLQRHGGNGMCQQCHKR